MNTNELNTITEQTGKGNKMPVLFLGHGNPMNAIEENEFVSGFRNVANEIPVPKAILCISAHWETKGTFVTAAQNPETIHDFGGFPKELFAVRYPAPGNPELAQKIKLLIKKTTVELNYTQGLDHGAWSVIKHLYPKADVPVIQMSLDYSKTPGYHYELAKELKTLRETGVLIIGSGNMVHNLGMVDWKRLNIPFGYDWALDANEQMKQFIVNNNHRALINYHEHGQSFRLSIPTPEHFLPLLYILALQEKTDRICFFNDKAVGGSLTMTCVHISGA